MATHPSSFGSLRPVGSSRRRGVVSFGLVVPRVKSHEASDFVWVFGEFWTNGDKAKKNHVG